MSSLNIWTENSFGERVGSGTTTATTARFHNWQDLMTTSRFGLLPLDSACFLEPPLPPPPHMRTWNTGWWAAVWFWVGRRLVLPMQTTNPGMVSPAAFGRKIRQWKLLKAFWRNFLWRPKCKQNNYYFKEWNSERNKLLKISAATD